jgi:hypothetical protein
VREFLQSDSLEGVGGIYPFSQDSQTFAKLSMAANGHVVKSRSDSSFASMPASRVCGMALVSNAVVESPGGVKGDHRPAVVVPVGTFSAPLGGWTVLLQFRDSASWEAYVSSNVSSSRLRQDETSDDEYSENIYQNTVWLAKILRQWLRGIELERESKTHSKALHYVRGVSSQAQQTILAINHMSAATPITDLSAAAALVDFAVAVRQRRGEVGVSGRGDADSPLAKSRSYYQPASAEVGEHLQAMCVVHEDGFDDNILRSRLHWSASDGNEGTWHTVSVRQGRDADRHHRSSPSKTGAGDVQWTIQSSSLSTRELQKAMLQGLVVCEEHDHTQHTPQKGRHSDFQAVRLLFSIREVPGHDVVMEVTLRTPDLHARENLLKASLSTNGQDCVAVLIVLSEYVRVLLRGALLSTDLSRSLSATTREESQHLDRINVIVRCLQELHVPKGHLTPVVAATEKILAQLPGCSQVRIHCIDESDGHVLYDSHKQSDQPDVSFHDDIMHGDISRLSPIFLSGEATGRDRSFDTEGRMHIDALQTPANTFQSINKKQSGHFKYEVEFQVYEVKGTVSVVTVQELFATDRAILQALIKAAGRRIYELYRGKRHKKAYAELQRDHEKTS